MPQSNFFLKLHLPGPGAYDLVSSDAEVAGYYALKQKVMEDEEKCRQAKKKLFPGTESTDSAMPSTCIGRGVR